MGLCQDNSSKDYHFVANTTSTSLSKMLAHHNKAWSEGVVPASTNEVNVFRGRLQTVFKNFKAKYS